MKKIETKARQHHWEHTQEASIQATTKVTHEKTKDINTGDIIGNNTHIHIGNNTGSRGNNT